MKDQNTPTNTLELHARIEEAIKKYLEAGGDPNFYIVSRSWYDKNWLEAVNKAVKDIPNKLIGLNVPGTPTLMSEMDKITVQDLRTKISELETPDQVEGEDK